MPSSQCFFVGVQDNRPGVPKVFLPRNRIFVHRANDLTWISDSRDIEIIILVHPFENLGGIKNLQHCRSETAAHGSQSTNMSWPPHWNLEVRVNITLVRPLDEVEKVE